MNTLVWKAIQGKEVLRYLNNCNENNKRSPWKKLFQESFVWNSLRFIELTLNSDEEWQLLTLRLAQSLEYAKIYCLTFQTLSLHNFVTRHCGLRELTITWEYRKMFTSGWCLF